MKIPTLFRANRASTSVLAIVAILVLAACQPIVDPSLLPQDEGSTGAATEQTVFDVEPAQATINTRSVRVRQGPAEAYDLVGGVEEGAKYPVLAMTSDGAWLQLEIADTPDSQGWVSTEFVTLEGDITNIPTVQAEEETAATAEDAAAATAEPPADAIGTATIDSPDLPLRVRAEPTSDVENKIGNVLDGESYPVLEVSPDGAWLKLFVPDLSENGGWIAAEFASVRGDAADLIAAAASTAEATPMAEEETPTVEATPVAVETPAAEETPVAEETPAEEDTPTVEATPLVEDTPVAEETPVAEVTAMADETPVAEETPVAVATETATVEATVEPTMEPTAEVQPEATTVEPSESSVSDEVIAPPATEIMAGDRVKIYTELPLRVRSAPTTAEDNKIGNVYNWDEFTVLEVSEDGLWIKIDATDLSATDLSEDGGWIAAEYAEVIQ